MDNTFVLAAIGLLVMVVIGIFCIAHSMDKAAGRDEHADGLD